MLGRSLTTIVRAIQTDLTHRAELTASSGARTGVVTLIQRFGSALNLNIHLHVLILDGVYTLVVAVTSDLRSLDFPASTGIYREIPCFSRVRRNRCRFFTHGTSELHRYSLAITSGNRICGKTTLLNLIAGIYHLDQGSIDTGGRRIGVVFQEPELFPWLTVGRNVEMGMRFRGVPAAQRREKARELLRLVHLDGFAERRPHELSGGMRQRVAIARALAQEADVLLMDEPFGALDAMTRDILHDELEAIWSRTQLTVLFVTHNVREAVRLGDRVVLLSSRPGRVVAEFGVAIPRPRRSDSVAVTELTARITDRLRDEVRRHGR